VRRDEGPSRRALRRGALADAPMALRPTPPPEQAFADAVWRERAERGASGDDSVTFIVEHDGRWLGIVTGLARDPDVPDDPRPELVSMFVAPEARGRGIGAALVDAVVGWAGARKATGLTLWVAAS